MLFRNGVKQITCNKLYSEGTILEPLNGNVIGSHLQTADE